MNQEENTQALNEQIAEEIIPEIQQNLELNPEINSEYPDHSSKSLREIIDIFQEMVDKGDQQEMYKYAEGIKAAFYKALKREKIAIGFQLPSDNADSSEEEHDENTVSNNPFAELERGFKELYSNYKALRTSFIQHITKQKEENLHIMLSLIVE